MIAKDILKYAQEHWLSDSGYKKTITEISKSGTSKALVESSKEIFCFDDISRDLYKRKDCLPTSADGMIITDNRKIYLVEFRQGNSPTVLTLCKNSKMMSRRFVLFSKL